MTTLDVLMDPEINEYTRSYYIIQNYIKKVPVKYILEIGGGGGGSTEAVIKGINESNNKNVKFISIELSKNRYNFLKNKFQICPYYIPYNTSSVTIDKLPSEEEVKNFIIKTGVHGGNVDMVLKWLRDDIEYSKNNGLNENGIQLIKNNFNIDKFCFVILDSGEFSSNAEFNELPNCDAYFLDDINAYKNWFVHRELEKNTNYVKIFQENIRGGSSLFCKKEIAEKYFKN
jgi:hypothetical protein